MTDLDLGIHTTIRRALCGDTTATALVRELARLYTAAGEPVPWQLRSYAPERAPEAEALNRPLADITKLLVLRCENLQRHAKELGSGLDDAWDNSIIETAKAAIAKCGMYYTPSEIVDFVAGSCTYLVDSSIIGNPPYVTTQSFVVLRET